MQVYVQCVLKWPNGEFLCEIHLPPSFLQDSLSPTTVSSPSSSRLVSQIIGAEDDYFDSDQEQVF